VSARLDRQRARAVLSANDRERWVDTLGGQLVLLRRRGHLPLHQGDEVDCARCGKTGRFDGEKLVGELATGMCEVQP
jgi:hypothetical protein